MDYVLELADLKLKLISERALTIEPEWRKFLVGSTNKADLEISVSWDWNEAIHPTSKLIGQDAILKYYFQNEYCFCVSMEGEKGAIAIVSYLNDLDKMICSINEKPFISSPDSIGRIMRALPIRQIFLQFNILFFHAAQILYKGQGILFAAPSGTGKTTQAKLWNQLHGAEIVCNDRTLVRKRGNSYMTYSYPLDGSEPICSTNINKLGAIVLLEQGKVNQINSMNSGKMLSMLMEQLVMDCWNPDSHEKNILLLLELIKEIPVFHYTCTPSLEAVEVLKKQLLLNGVIENGENH